jgi:N-acetylglucosamine-6-phosphate deacetylase
MERWLFFNVYLFTTSAGWLPGWLLTEGNVIRWLGPGQPPEFPDGYITRLVDGQDLNLLPGFIDIHAHGAVGHEVMDANVDGLREMQRFYARHGVTGFLATTWTATHKDLLLAIDAINHVSGYRADGASILGIHLEGPYLNPARCGAQDSGLIRRPDPGEVLELIESGPVKLVTLAPEFPENLQLVDTLVQRGITVSAGHTDATYEEMLVAVGHGVRQVTHTFNAMSPFNQRQPGAIGAALALPELSCQLIADGIHVHAAAMRLLLNAKGSDGVILVTDSIRGTGLMDGDYAIDNRIVHIKDGAVRLPDGTLAGSVLTMERAVQNLIAATGQSLLALWKTSSLNAARSIGIASRKGSLEVGKDADLVLVGANLDVMLTMVEGQIAYTNPIFNDGK